MSEQPNTAILELQKQAMELAKQDKMAKWQSIEGYTYQEVGIRNLAQLYYEAGYAQSIPHGFILAMHVAKYDFKIDPAEGHVFVTEKGKIGSTVEGLKIKAEHKGVKFGHPHTTQVERPWPKGLIKKNNKGAEFSFDIDLGWHCVMNIDGEDCEYTAWMSEWFMPNSMVWQERPMHMLRVRSIGNCIKFSSGVGISEELGDPEEKAGLPAPQAKAAVAAPSRIPTGFSNAMGTANER